jgi:hypothetical protein
VGAQLHSDTEYSPGKEYVYRYQSKIITGVPHHANENAGLVLKCQLKLQFKERQQVLAKCDQLEVFTIQAGIQYQEDVPEQLLRPASSEVTQQLVEQVQKPFIFRYNEGDIHDVQVDSSEPSFSINIKKGILNLLKVKLVDDSPDNMKLREQWRELKHDGGAEEDNDLFKYYKLIEDGISGRCESIYTITPYAASILGMKVSKVINYDKCPEQPIWEEGIFSSLTTLGQGQKRRQSIEKYSSANYKILGDPQRFMIQQVNLTSTFVIQPLSDKHGRVVSAVNQSLELLEINEVPRSLPNLRAVDMKMLQQPLKFEFPQYEFDRPSSLEISRYSSSQRVQVAQQLLEEIIRSSTPIVQDQTISSIRKLKTVLKYMQSDELVQLVKQVQQENQGQTKQRFLMDVIPSVGTPEVLKAIVKLLTIERSQVDRQQVISMLKEVSLHLKPNSDVLEIIKPENRILFNEEVRQDKQLQKQVLLSVGSILHRVRVHANNSATQRDIVRPHLQQIAREMTVLFNQQQVKDKVVVLKAIGNSGVPEFLPMIKSIIRDKSLESTVRMAAIFATRRIQPEHKKLVEQVILPLYVDKYEPHELRIAAFALVMDQKPSNDTLQVIVNVQKQEKSIQVGTFVYKYWLSTSKASMPSLVKLASDIKRLLPLLRPFSPKEYSYSMPYHQDLLSDYLEIGLGLDAHKLQQSDSPVPTFLSTKLSGYLLGKSSSLLEVGVQGRGLKVLLGKVLGPYQYLVDKVEKWDDFVDLIQKPLKMADYGHLHQETRSIIEKLNIQERELSDNLDLSVYIKILSNELHFFNFSKEDLEQMRDDEEQYRRGYQNDQQQDSQQLDCLRALVLGKNSYKVPTPMGVAVSYNSSAIGVLRAVGQASKTPYKAIDLLKSILGYKDVSMDADVQATSSIIIEHRQFIGADLEILSTGVTTKSQAKLVLPLDLKLSVQNGQISQVELKYQTGSQQQQVLQASHEPSTFVCQRKQSSELPEDYTIEKQPLRKPEVFHPVRVQVPVELSALGVQLDVSAELPNIRPSWMHTPALWAPLKVEITSSPIQPQETIVFKVDYSKTSQQEQGKQQNYRNQQRFSDKLSGDVDPTVEEPCKHALNVQVGPESQDASRMYSVLGFWAHSPYLEVNQLKAVINVPSMQSRQHEVDILLNLKSLLNKQEDLLKLEYENEQSGILKVKLTPEQDTVTYDSLVENSFYRMLKEKLDIDVSASKKEQCPTPNSYDFALNVEYSDLSDNFQQVIDFANKTISYRLWPSYIWQQDYPSYSQLQSGEIQGHLKVVPKWNKAIVELKTPSQRQLSAEIPLKWFLWTSSFEDKLSVVRPAVNGSADLYQIKQLLHYPSNTDILSSLSYGQCEIIKSGQKDEVMTFDKRRYSLPEVQYECESLIAKDCSPANLFTLLMSKNNGEKKLRLLVPKHKIELVPSTSWTFSKSLDVIVDGQSIDVPSYGPKELTESNPSYERSVFGKVSKKDDTIILELPKIGLLVTFDGDKVGVKTCHLLRSSLCGLCGNHNGEPSDDFQGTQLQQHQSERHLMADYLVPSDKCRVDSIKQSLDIKDSSKICQPVHRTKHMDTIMYNQKMTCFTVDPLSVKVCPSGCVPTKIIPRRVGMHCLDANNINTFRLKQYAQSRVLDEELRNMPITKYEDIAEAVECVGTPDHFRA